MNFSNDIILPLSKIYCPFYENVSSIASNK